MTFCCKFRYTTNETGNVDKTNEAWTTNVIADIDDIAMDIEHADLYDCFKI